MITYHGKHMKGLADVLRAPMTRKGHRAPRREGETGGWWVIEKQWQGHA